jgi:RimJ/RimL family protein N-acetyltransferase
MAAPKKSLPLGPPVPPAHTSPPQRSPLEGTFFRLRPIDPARDAAGLFAISHSDPAVEALWTYLPYGPFPEELAMRKWLTELAGPGDPLFFTVCRQADQQPVGMTAYQNIFPDHRRLEIGHIWFGPPFQRTKANTEMAYLMLEQAFQGLHYRRVEWKCDALNARSRAAAERLGFRYEGLFRQHVIVKGRSRDTCWYAMMDHEWPRIRQNMRRWLYSGETGLSLKDLNLQT